MKDYYKILEVNSSASQEIISKVYKILAKKYHPDTNPDNKQEAEEKFKELSEAYEILSNKEKREAYDIELENFKNSQSTSITQENYDNLKMYCIELQNEIEFLKAQSNNYSNNEINSNTTFHTNANTNKDYNEVTNQAYQDAMNKAYNDVYENTLRNLGYKIRYKKTFKQKLKNIFALVIWFIIMFIIFSILWQLPSFRQNFEPIFSIFGLNI